MIEYIYLTKQVKANAICKIGITTDYKKRLAQYNGTGTDPDNLFEFLFLAEVKDMKELEKAIKKEFSHLRHEKEKEMYFYNNELFNTYKNFIQIHNSFIKEIKIKNDNVRVAKEIVIKTAKKPTMEERGVKRIDVLNRAKINANTIQKIQKSGYEINIKTFSSDEYYTRIEDIEKEIIMYDKKIWNGKVVFCNCDDAVGDTRTLKIVLLLRYSF